MRKKLVVLSGAGVSAESGIKTFRDADGLWEGHDVMTVATPEGWSRNRSLVLDFYNQRRKQLHEVSPNEGHLIIAQLEEHYAVTVITQNVDDLHERAGSTHVIHLHGELRKVRSEQDESYVIDWLDDINEGDLCPNGHQLRPHIVWFGEAVPMMDRAIPKMVEADIVIIIGTSLQVYPAVGLSEYCKPSTPIYYIDPNPVNVANINSRHEITTLTTSGSAGMQQVAAMLLQ